ncbi:alanine racemase [Pseudolabrys sp. FHR47]|uniref:alanine racemase n=1 Tax=Pseudolabrys sp. FHR47 TaxID=2562284 RepID=UPI001FF063CE|nr:alanine racemase [Pseudolabrys sp. FHR47]
MRMATIDLIETAPPVDTGIVEKDGPPAVQAGGTLTIDLGALTANWQTLRRRATPAECAAVVKANAYGLGIEPVVHALAKEGCKTFFVAELSEARRVRAAAPDAAIYVLNGVMPGAGPEFSVLKAKPVISSTVELAEWDAYCAASGWRGGAALHVDTGMNRLGVSINEAAALAHRIRAENHGIHLLMSHFACAEETDNALNEKQIKLFREVRLLYRGIPASLSNSSGIFLGDTAHCDVVRPGVALYGVNPTPDKPNPMRPVVDLKVRVLQVRSVTRGDTVGYSATWTARRATRIAVIAAGYADGLSRASGSTDETPGGSAIVAGKLCPIAGRVSMDLTTIDVSELPEGAVRRGDMVTLIGDALTLDEVARGASTIGYEILTSLGRRYHRVYRRD